MASYALTSDFALYGLLPSASVNLSNVQAQLDAVSAMFDGYLGVRMQLPIKQPYGLDLVMRVCHVAAWNVLLTRGFNPDNPGDLAVKERHDLAMAWIRDVRNQVVTPPWTVEPTSTQYSFPNVQTQQPRGW